MFQLAHPPRLLEHWQDYIDLVKNARMKRDMPHRYIL